MNVMLDIARRIKKYDYKMFDGDERKALDTLFKCLMTMLKYKQQEIKSIYTLELSHMCRFLDNAANDCSLFTKPSQDLFYECKNAVLQLNDICDKHHLMPVFDPKISEYDRNINIAVGEFISDLYYDYLIESVHKKHGAFPVCTTYHDLIKLRGNYIQKQDRISRQLSALTHLKRANSSAVLSQTDSKRSAIAIIHAVSWFISYYTLVVYRQIIALDIFKDFDDIKYLDMRIAQVHNDVFMGISRMNQISKDLGLEPFFDIDVCDVLACVYAVVQYIDEIYYNTCHLNFGSYVKEKERVSLLVNKAVIELDGEYVSLMPHGCTVDRFLYDASQRAANTNAVKDDFDR